MRLLDLAGKVRQVAWAKLRLRGCDRVGALPRLEGAVHVRNGGRIELGDRVRFRGSHVAVEIAALPGGVLTIGDNCSINSGASIAASQRVSIGSDCLIGNYSLIMDTDFHDIDRRDERGESKPVVIEDGVWLGARVTVLKGVTIGRGAAVVAGSVVTRDVPPYTLAGGMPARPIRALRRPGEPEPETAETERGVEQS